LPSFVASGGLNPGVLLVIPQNAPILDVVEALILIWADDRSNDWQDLVAKIPFWMTRAVAKRKLI
jgi:hypothetical protein